MADGDGEGGSPPRRSSFVIRTSHHLPRHLQPVDLQRAHRSSLPVPVDWKSSLPSESQAEAPLRIGQRVTGDDLLDVRGLGGRLLEELEPRRHIGEEVLDRDGRADGRAGQPALDLAAFGQADEGAGVRVQRARQQGHLRHGCDAGQRLAAKPERGDVAQIIGEC